MKRIVSILLVVALLMSGLFFVSPVGFATQEPIEEEPYDFIYPLEDGAIYFDTPTGTIYYGYGGGELEIPAVINGAPVRNIAPSAFDASMFTSIVVPEGVEEIGINAFAACRALSHCSLPSTLKEIPGGAFSGCSNLRTVDLPPQLEKIGTLAFHSCRPLKDLTFPETLVSIGDSAFSDCTQLTVMTIGENVKELGSAVFARCEKLEQVILPSTLTAIPVAFVSECTKLTMFDIPESVTYIGDRAFEECAGLTDIVIPDGVTHIGEEAFYKCGLAKQPLPKSLTYLGKKAFYATKCLESRNTGQYVDNWLVGTRSGEKGELVIDEGTIGAADGSIGYENLPSSPEVKALQIPSTLRYLTADSFLSTEELASITVSEDNPYFASKNNVIYNKDMTTLIFVGAHVNFEETPLSEGLKVIESRAFKYNERTKRIVLPDSLERLEDESLGNGDLVRVEFGKGLKYIGARILDYNYINAITLPDGLEYIGEEAFSCSGLAYVDLGESIKYIGPRAFAHNPQLQKIELPETLEELGDNAFGDCDALKTAIFHGDVPKMGKTAFCSYFEELTNNPATALDDFTIYYVNEGNWLSVTEYNVEKWQVPAKANFKDVKAGSWYETAVNYAVENELMNGVGGRSFAPNGSMTRGMVVTVLWRFMGEEDHTYIPYEDVKASDWYGSAVAWASSHGIVTGVDRTHFNPNGDITREQLATILFRYAQMMQLNMTRDKKLDGFADHKKVSSYAQAALQWSVSCGLINGEEIGGKMYLNPQGKATRAQVATILMRMIEQSIKQQ